MSEENLLQENKQVTPQELTKIIGSNMVTFLNKAGVAPARASSSMNEHKAWAQCCDFAISLMEGHTICVNGSLGPAISAMQEAKSEEEGTKKPTKQTKTKKGK